MNQGINTFTNEKLISSGVTSVLLLGSPLVDLIIKTTPDFLETYNLQADNAYILNNDTKTIFEDIKLYKPIVEVGGSVTNTARVLRKLTDPCKIDVVYLGAVGKDDFGAIIKDKLKNENIRGHFVDVSGENTGKVAVLIEGKKRSLVTDLGASKFFRFEDLIQASVWNDVENSQYIYISAFFVRVCFKTVKKLIEMEEKKVIINLGAPFLCGEFKTEISYMYEKAHVIIGNESEHRAFAKASNINADNLHDVILRTLEKSQTVNKISKIIVVTRGEKSVLVVADSNNKLALTEYPVRLLHPDDIADTNGAGDAFVGGFLAGYVAGHSLATSVESGITAAHGIIQCSGFNLNQLEATC